MKRFPNGARIVFIGDSLVAENIAQSYIIDTYNKKFGKENFRFFNCGIAGGTAESALRYFDKDILRHNPTHAIVALGVNDSERWHIDEKERGKERYALLAAAYEKYKENMRALISKLKENNVEILLCTPAPYDEYTKTNEPALSGGYALILGYANFVRCLAKEENLPLCDIHAYLAELIQSERCYSDDHIHPQTHGYYLIAKHILNFQGIEIGEEYPLSEKIEKWRAAVLTLRTVYACEYMLIKDTSLSDAEKIAMMKERVEKKDFGGVFEKFIRCYAENKEKEEALYSEIERLYEQI